MYTMYLALDALSRYRCRASILDGATDLVGVRIGPDYLDDCICVDDPEGDVECVNGEDRIVVPGATIEEVTNILIGMGERISRWELELSRLSMGGTVKEILDSLSSMLSCPAILVESRNMMCTMSDAEPDVPISEWDYARSFGRLPWPMFDRMERDMMYQSKLLSSQGKPFSTAICEDGRESVACKIECEDSPKMLLLVFDSGRGMSPGMVQLVSLAVDAIRRWIDGHRGEQSIFSMMDILSRLAIGDEVPEEEIVSQRRRMAPDGAHFVLMQVVHDLNGGNARAASLFQSEITQSRCFEVRERLYALCVYYHGIESDLDVIAMGRGMRFGLSWRFTNWKEIPDAVNQTEVALSSYAGSVVALDSHCVMFYIFSILMSCTSNIEIIHPAITDLSKYDEEHGSEYLRTLWSYLRHERNLVRTAEDLGLHRNSLVYRVQRISKLIPDVDLDDPETRDHLMVSYRVNGLRNRTEKDSVSA